MKKISTFHLVLISAGGMLGSGWLFSPFYGLQTAGSGVLLSWGITALLTLIIGLTFAEVATILPIVGGIMRFMGVTHSRPLGFLFITLAWVSYIVYLPLEAQSAIQYIGFWIPSLVEHKDTGAVLSKIGLIVAFGIMVFLTWFNTQHLSKVAKANSVVSIWKLIIPISIAICVIIMFGKPEHFMANHSAKSWHVESILLAVTSSGLAFAFAGFQNGLILANSAKDPKKAIPISIIAPIVIGLIIYSTLSLMFMWCLPDASTNAISGVAPLLGLLSLLGLHYVYVILFVDAVIAPLGTANVYTTATGKILFGIGREFFPNSVLTKLNKFSAPHIALWINMVLGCCFLLPFPTWTELVNFLSSLTLLSCISGPIALMVLRERFPDLERKFKLPFYKVFGYLGFVSCTYFVYWSGTDNLLHLVYLIILGCISYWLIFARNTPLLAFKRTWFLTAYIISLYGISYAHSAHVIGFPQDNYIIFAVGIIFTKIFMLSQEKVETIAKNIDKMKLEILGDQ